MSPALFGPSRFSKNLDPALEPFTDSQLAAREGIPSWVTEEDISAELSQRARNRELTAETPTERICRLYFARFGIRPSGVCDNPRHYGVHADRYTGTDPAMAELYARQEGKLGPCVGWHVEDYQIKVMEKVLFAYGATPESAS